MLGQGKECKGIKGIIEETQEILKADTAPEALDAALVGAMQRVEHYEMASYSGAVTFADLLGYSEASDLLEETLDDEEETNEKLTELAESRINEKAMKSKEE